MRALNRQVLLLKDQRMPRLPADMTGKVYHPLDSYNISETIGREINKWVEKDLGIGRIGEQAEILALMEHLPRTVVVLARFTEERKTFYEDILDNLETRIQAQSVRFRGGSWARRSRLCFSCSTGAIRNCRYH